MAIARESTCPHLEQIEFTDYHTRLPAQCGQNEHDHENVWINPSVRRTDGIQSKEKTFDYLGDHCVRRNDKNFPEDFPLNMTDMAQ